jgi:[acyl-carrier-protein] S-malonyltransferase
MEQTIVKLKEMGVDTIVEIGPGKTLAGFVKKTVDGIKVYSIDSYADYETVVKEMAS